MYARRTLIAVVLGLNGATGAARADIDTGLIWRFAFDGNAQDSGPHHFDGIVNGGVTFPSEGRIGGCARFNGTDAWIRVNHGGIGTFDLDTQSYSISVWVRIDSPTSEGAVLTDRHGNNVRVSYSLAYHPAMLGDDLYNDSWWGTFSDVTCSRVTTQLSPYLGQWHHVATTYNVSTRTKVLYVDGAQVQAVLQCPAAFPSPGPSNSTTTIGALWGSCACMSNFFKGDMDELRLYDRVLDPADVRALYCAGNLTGFVDGFNQDAVGSFPIQWESRFGGDGQSVVAAPAFAGDRSFKQVAGAAAAAESHTVRRFKSVAATASIDFALLWSSESTNPGIGCNDITVDYQGDRGSFRAGFVGKGGANTGLVIQGTNIPVEQDRWYQFHGVADFDTLTVTWYVDDDLVIPCEPMLPGAADPARTNRIEFHVGCIDTGQSVAYLDTVRFSPGRACRADHNGNRLLTVQDIFDFLADYFAGCS